MTQLELELLMALERPWENHGRGYQLRPDGPGVFTRLWRRLRGGSARSADRAPRLAPADTAAIASESAQDQRSRAA